jgi:diguanylate cyclase (GGDEF)-like protein/PAS domain S-box-containing protein
MPDSTAQVLPFTKRLQDRLQAVLDALPVAVSWAGIADQKIEFVNRKFTELFGYRLGDHATVADWIERAYPDQQQAERARNMWMHHFGRLDADTVEIPPVEVDVRCSDGKVRTTLLGGVIMPDVGWALATFVDITERKRSEQFIQRLALEDPLTGLPNRRAFSDSIRRYLARARRQQSGGALLIVDLDGFKQLNDSLGHDCGDHALQAMAGRLRSTIRGSDTACRLGGDEFAILLEAGDPGRVAGEVAARIIDTIREPLNLDQGNVTLDASIGIALFDGATADEDTLYRDADQALYRAKNAGRGRWSR